MATTGGYQPGTYQAADLNRLQSIFGAAGIARGMQVTQTSPLGMSVYVTVSGAGDGVCYLPNGGWVRIDAQLTLSVPANSSGSTRNDAVVATMDPTGGLGVPTVAYVTNWAGGFGGGTNNQLVLALVSVANNATQITSGNITMTTAAASFGNAASAGISNTVAPIGTSNGAYVSQIQTSTVGFGLGVKDNTSQGAIEVFPVALSGTPRGLTLDWVDTANVLHAGIQIASSGAITIQPPATFSSSAIFSNNVSVVGTVTASQHASTVYVLDPNALNGESAGSLTVQGVSPGGGGGNADIHIKNPTTGYVYVDSQSGNSHFDNHGGLILAGTGPNLTGNITADYGNSIYPKYNTTGMRIFMANTTAGISFQKYDLFLLIPFN